MIATVIGATLTTLLAIATAATITTTTIVLASPPLAFAGTLALSRAKLLPAPIVFYKRALTTLVVTGLVLAMAGEPVVDGLDLAAIGIGSFLAVGRLGCFCVSCCHGKRARTGVRYGWAHAASGFPSRWVGLPIFPIQLVDSAAAGCAVTIAAALELSHHRPGAPLAAFACAYGASRFAIELARGDDARRYFAGMSEPQWTAVATTAAAAVSQPSWWAVATAGLLAGVALAFAIARRRGWWLHLWLTTPRHLVEIEAALDRLIANGPAQTTSEGLRLSLATRVAGGFELALHARRPLSPRTLRVIGGQLGRDWTVDAIRERNAIVLSRGVSRDALAS